MADMTNPPPPADDLVERLKHDAANLRLVADHYVNPALDHALVNRAAANADTAADALALLSREKEDLKRDVPETLRDVLYIFSARPDIMERIRPLMGFAEWGALSKARTLYARLSARKDNPDAG